ncbi:hypothetical protein BDY24DRAFT_281182 [Mrakia frigida]|uniref:uncharacterized protein n=1 Tax=Mrakia frigida TaxID=29902 RepID=UPI003FCC25D3
MGKERRQRVELGSPSLSLLLPSFPSFARVKISVCVRRLPEEKISLGEGKTNQKNNLVRMTWVGGRGEGPGRGVVELEVVPSFLPSIILSSSPLSPFLISLSLLPSQSNTMSNSIEDWRKANAHPKQLPLPSLLSKLNILPPPERLPAPDDSALDTRSESSVDAHTSIFLASPRLSPHWSTLSCFREEQRRGDGREREEGGCATRSMTMTLSLSPHSEERSNEDEERAASMYWEGGEEVVLWGEKVFLERTELPSLSDRLRSCSPLPWLPVPSSSGNFSHTSLPSLLHTLVLTFTFFLPSFSSRAAPPTRLPSSILYLLPPFLSPPLPSQLNNDSSLPLLPPSVPPSNLIFPRPTHFHQEGELRWSAIRPSLAHQREERRRLSWEGEDLG